MQIEADGSFGTAKLKTYPPRLCGSILMGFIDHFATHFDASSDTAFPRDFSKLAAHSILERCEDIRAQSVFAPEVACDFSDQDLEGAVSHDPELAALALWPDRDASMGRDFAF